MTKFLALRSTPIVGLYFRPAETKDWLAANIDDLPPLTLERDPTNEHDTLAIKVMAGEYHLGFIPKTINPLLATLMDNGHGTEVNLTGFNPKKPEIEVYVITPS